MPLLGAHQSIAGGYYKAVEIAAGFGMDCVQLFTKNNNQWRAKPLAESEIDEFQAALKSTGIQQPCAHDSYLINLASPDDALWEKSLDAYVVELERAEALGLIGVVMHPGSFVSSTEEAGLKRIVQALDLAHRRTQGFQTLTLLETTAGQGTNLGHRFEHLAFLLNETADGDRMQVCVDTCHIFAAGYPIGTKSEYEATMSEFDRLIGLSRIRAFHLNDSVKELGSRVDRHARIGAGKIGVEPFRLLLNDPRFANVPMYMETPKGEEGGEQLDAINLRTLRGLVSAVKDRQSKKSEVRNPKSETSTKSKTRK
jgi:deoxyribonuclease IV